MRVSINLDLKGKNNSEMITFGSKVFKAMTGNTYFPSASVTPPLSTLDGAIIALSTAESNKGKGKLSTEQANAARRKLDSYMVLLVNYVENVANNPTVLDNDRETIVKGAGFELKASSKRKQQAFKAKAGDITGNIKLSAPGIKYGTHEWHYTNDPLGKTGWIAANPSTKATTMVDGLTPGESYIFRHRTIGKDGPSDWEQTEPTMAT